MKKKIIIISASLILVAIVAVVATNAQTKSAVDKTSKTELNNDQIPDGCKGCPDASTCYGESSQKESRCAHDCKSAKCDEAKCGEKQKEESSCCNENKDEKHCSSATSCEKDCSSKK